MCSHAYKHLYKLVPEDCNLSHNQQRHTCALAPAKGRHSLCVLEDYIHKLLITINEVFWNEVAEGYITHAHHPQPRLSALSWCLVLGQLCAKTCSSAFLPEHMGVKIKITISASAADQLNAQLIVAFC